MAFELPEEAFDDQHTALVFFFFSSRRRHTRCSRDWSSDVCSSDLLHGLGAVSISLRILERRVADTANETWAILVTDHLLVRLLIRRCLTSLVVHRVKRNLVKFPRIPANRLDCLVNP